MSQMLCSVLDKQKFDWEVSLPRILAGIGGFAFFFLLSDVSLWSHLNSPSLRDALLLRVSSAGIFREHSGRLPPSRNSRLFRPCQCWPRGFPKPSEMAGDPKDRKTHFSGLWEPGNRRNRSPGKFPAEHGFWILDLL